MLQQAIGGVEGEIRVTLQYFFQAWGSRGPDKCRDMLLSTATEEIGHIEMLATAVAPNLEGAPEILKEEAAREDPAVAAVLEGMSMRHYLSTGVATLPTDADGVPFDAAHVYASGNIAADMYASAMAESTGRVLATRLWEFTDNPGVKDMLAFLIARDTMHQQQWLAVVEELGGYEAVLPIPNSFPQEENQEVRYTFIDNRIGEDIQPLEGRFTSGASLDGNGEFSHEFAFPRGEKPELGPAAPETYPQQEQMEGEGDAATPAT